MQTLGNLRDHFWRVIKMAKANKLDLSEALDQGRISSHDYADMITACRGCAQIGKCDRLLARVAEMEAPPEYCVNKNTFHMLKSR